MNEECTCIKKMNEFSDDLEALQSSFEEILTKAMELEKENEILRQKHDKLLEDRYTLLAAIRSIKHDLGYGLKSVLNRSNISNWTKVSTARWITNEMMRRSQRAIERGRGVYISE